MTSKERAAQDELARALEIAMNVMKARGFDFHQSMAFDIALKALKGAGYEFKDFKGYFGRVKEWIEEGERMHRVIEECHRRAIEAEKKRQEVTRWR